MFGFGKKVSLEGLHIAILTTDGVEHTELTAPWKALRDAGAEVYVVANKLGTFATLRKLARGDDIPVDATVDEVRPQAFAALFMPGSTRTLDALKKENKVLDFIREFMKSGKPIAAISSGPGLLALAGPLRGQTVTSSLAVREELQRAGAVWVDQAVVEDDQLLTARGPKDLKAFTKKLVPHFAQAER